MAVVSVGNNYGKKTGFPKKKELILAVNGISFLHAHEKCRLLEICRDLNDIRNLHFSDLGSVIRERNIYARKIEGEKIVLQALRDLDYLNKDRSVEMVSIEDFRYPDLLKEIYNPPFLLFYRGELPTRCQKNIAVVGTRRASFSSLRESFLLGLEWGINGGTVVSGLASGIDTAAHEGNLRAGAKTVAVLGHGIDTIYPLSNRPLARKILEKGGAIISEFAPGVLPGRYTFPKRNRIISGLSKSVIIAQAPLKSGALITADFALEQGRDLYILPSGLGNLHGAGGEKLYNEGAPLLFDYASLSEDFRASEKWKRVVSQEVPLNREDIISMIEKDLNGEFISYRGERYSYVG